MTVSSSTNRVSYAGNGSTTVFPYTYKIFDQDDLTVILRAANGTETVKAIVSDYTVSGVGSPGGGNVTMLTAPATGETLVVIRVQDLIQELDIVPNDPFSSESLEGALDRLTFMVQQHEETLGRTIKASRTNTISGAEFTISAADRANKLFAFDSSGNVNITQNVGIFRGNWAAGVAFNERDLVKDTTTDNIFIVNTAHVSSGALPITTNADAAKFDLILDVNAFNVLFDQFETIYLGSKSSDPATDNDGDPLIDGALYFNTTDNRLKVYDLGNTVWKFTAPSPAEQGNIDALGPIAADVSAVAAIDSDVTTVAGIDANVTTVAGISANVTTVAGISADVTAVAGDATDIGTVATDLTGANTIGTVAGVAANVTTVAGISADVTAVAGDATDIGTVSSNIANVNTVGGISANVTTVAGISADVTAVAGDATDIGTVSSNIANVNTVAGISADVTTVAADGTDIGTVATNIANVNTVAGISANVTTVAGISADVTAVAGDATDIGVVATNITNVNTVAGISANVTTVAGISADVTAVAGDATDIGTVSSNIANVNTVAGISGNVTTVAGISADVTAVAGDATDIGTVAGVSAAVATVAGISANVTTVAGISADVTSLATSIGSIDAITYSDLLPIEVLHTVAFTVPRGFWDTGERLFAGAAERMVISNWNVEADLLAGAIDGTWYNITGLFTDTGGTVAVTAAGQEVRNMTDQTGADRAATGSGGLFATVPRPAIFSNAVSSTLVVDLPYLGNDCTIGFSTDEGTTILTGQTVGGRTEVLIHRYLFGYVIVDRAISVEQTARLTQYLDALRLGYVAPAEYAGVLLLETGDALLFEDDDRVDLQGVISYPLNTIA
jgi:hypothetical protein